MSDGLSSDSGHSVDNGISGGGSLQAPVERTTVTTESVCVSAPAEVGAKERNLMFVVTGCASLFMSVGGFFTILVWHLYSVTNHLPVDGLVTDWALGVIFTPLGGAAVVWLQNQRKK